MKVIKQKNTEKLNRHIFIRDNLDVLRALDDDSVDLIYLDPPFNKNKTYGAPIGSEVAGKHFKDIWTLDDVKNEWWGELADKHPSVYEIIHAVGCINGDRDKAYLIAMAMRLLELHRVLTDTGSIYLHCDQTMSHSLKLLMDAIFRKKNKRTEIIWHRIKGAGKRTQHKPKKYAVATDSIFFYTKTRKFYFEIENACIPLSKKQLKKFKLKDKKGRYYRRSPFNSKGQGARPNQCYTYNGFTPPHPSGWNVTKKTLKKMIREGDIEFVDGKVYRKQRPKGILANSLWTDIKIPPKDERTKYSTQKPLALLERIIKASSKEGDLVLDPFCGCATTCVASEKLKRQWIGIDFSPLAEKLVKQRLLKQFKKGNLGKKMINPIIRNTLPIKDAPKPSEDIKHTLYGKQKGHCNGCKVHFEFRMFQLDHIVPKAKGGQDTDKNLQLLCGPCNSLKGIGNMSELKVKLKKKGFIITTTA